jgi:nucleotide-binding universal stress UspA family protein
MTMLQHVLVPLDGSDLGEEGLIEAKRIVSTHSRITLVLVVKSPEILGYGYDLIGVDTASLYEAKLEKTLRCERSYLEGITKGLKLQGYQTQLMVQFGEPASVIVSIAEHLRVDAIVMATHGRSDVSRWLFGSVTSKVLASAACPVVVIPSACKQQLLEMDKPELHYG